jgi:hypothetical protein
MIARFPGNLEGDRTETVKNRGAFNSASVFSLDI